MGEIELKFGYYPKKLEIQAGPVAVESLPDLADAVESVNNSVGVEGKWIYAPTQKLRSSDGSERERPYLSRVFGLPQTHVIRHANADGNEHLEFHIWMLSFFTGMRLTATTAGFLDATPVEPGSLTDFGLYPRCLCKAVESAETFWVNNRVDTKRASLIAATVHALFLGQNPQNLQFESFIFLYMAFDACFALLSEIHPQNAYVKHQNRIPWMCNLFSIPIPSWAGSASAGSVQVAAIRNATIHEALFMGQPLGFALHGEGTNQNITLEMEALICRLIFCALGHQNIDYVKTPVDTRSRYLIRLT